MTDAAIQALAAAKQHDWKALELSRRVSFNVIELWIENRVRISLHVNAQIAAM